VAARVVAGRMFIVPKPCRREFREDVVRVARQGDVDIPPNREGMDYEE
jgi:hypothetical protein